MLAALNFSGSGPKARRRELSKTIWERIESSRRRWNVLEHPFYQRWSDGELTAEELARYSGQYRHAVEAIATLSAIAADALPDRDELRRHAAEELGPRPALGRLRRGRGRRASAAPTPETAACVEGWTAEGRPLELLARLYAVEVAQPAISRTKREGLLERYGFEDGSAPPTSGSTRAATSSTPPRSASSSRSWPTDADADRIVAAAERAYEANWRLLDGV